MENLLFLKIRYNRKSELRVQSFLIKNSRIYENMSWNRLGPIVQRLVCCGKTWRFLRVLTLFTLFALSRFQPDVEWCSSSTKWPWHFEGGLSEPEGGGPRRGACAPPSSFLIDQFTLSQPGGQIMPTTLVSAPGFSDFPTALTHWRRQGTLGDLNLFLFPEI